MLLKSSLTGGLEEKIIFNYVRFIVKIATYVSLYLGKIGSCHTQKLWNSARNGIFYERFRDYDFIQTTVKIDCNTILFGFECVLRQISLKFAPNKNKKLPQIHVKLRKSDF